MDEYKVPSRGIATRCLNGYHVFAHNSPAEVSRVFPSFKHAEVSGQQYCAVPATLDHSRVLTNMGYHVSSPIRYDYKWSGQKVPRWYQVETSEFFTLYPRAHCHSKQRTGKTLSALWAADFLMERGLINRCLVVAPLSTLSDVWENELFFEFPHRTCAVLHGSREKRHKLLDIPYDFYIINHDGPNVVLNALLAKTGIDCIIIDEIAEFKSAQTHKWKALKKVCNNKTYVWGLTGTPTPQAPTDAFGQMKLVTPENFTGSFTRFKDMTMQKISLWKWIPRKDCEKMIASALRPSIQFGREVCTDLEPCIIDRKVELSEEQKKYYRKMKQDAILEFENGKQVTAVNSAVLAGKIMQISTGFVYDEKGVVVEFDHTPRMNVLKELIAENDEKVIVLAPFTGALHILKKELSKTWSCVIVDGSTPKNQRDQIFQAFRTQADPHIILANAACMAHGLDLTAATLTIWYAPTNKNSIYAQANARMDGSKQKIKIDIARIYATPEEKALYTSLEGKTKFQDVILDLLKKPM